MKVSLKGEAFCIEEKGFEGREVNERVGCSTLLRVAATPGKSFGITRASRALPSLLYAAPRARPDRGRRRESNPAGRAMKSRSF